MATARVDELIREAQTIAEDIYLGAEREAERHLMERRREAEDLVSRRRALVDEVFETLRRDLDAAQQRATTAIDSVADHLSDPSPSAPRPLSVARPTVVTESAADFAAARRSEPIRARALVRVAQLAATGRGRDEIETLFREEFGVAPPPGVVDQILRS